MTTNTDADIRVTCTACRHYVGGCCTNARKALLTHRAQRIDIGREFAALRQHCHGFAASAATTFRLQPSFNKQHKGRKAA